MVFTFALNFPALLGLYEVLALILASDVEYSSSQLDYYFFGKFLFVYLSSNYSIILPPPNALKTITLLHFRAVSSSYHRP